MDTTHGPLPEEMRDEYEFDYSKARPNRFARESTQNVVMVELEPDVAAVFMTADSVNKALRAMIDAMPDSR